jgi:predicted nucleic acid-binding protein
LILVDTSVWINHLHKPIPALVAALEAGEVLIHPFVLGELACGQLAKRREILDLLSALPQSTMATDEEMLPFIEHHRLMGKGLGYIDAHLLASVILTEAAQLWTADRGLAAIAKQLRVGFAIP